MAARNSGTMLWFNAARDVGAMRTADGDRIDVPGKAFLPGEKPAGRCAGKAVEFDSVKGAVSAVAFVPDETPRRARRRRR